MAEFAALAHARERGLPVVIARVFNTIGPRQVARYGMVVPTFIEQALSGRPLTVYGNGRQTRAFADVADTVAALIGLAEHPAAVGEVFNVGSDEETTVLDVAKRVIALTGSASQVELVPYRIAYGEGFEDMARRVPDLEKLRRLLGLAPCRGLTEILRRAIAGVGGG
jgi:UDP-glucose 4-epimerase